jgi:hypothetical protein
MSTASNFLSLRMYLEHSPANHSKPSIQHLSGNDFNLKKVGLRRPVFRMLNIAQGESYSEKPGGKLGGFAKLGYAGEPYLLLRVLAQKQPAGILGWFASSNLIECWGIRMNDRREY